MEQFSTLRRHYSSKQTTVSCVSNTRHRSQVSAFCGLIGLMILQDFAKIIIIIVIITTIHLSSCEIEWMNSTIYAPALSSVKWDYSTYFIGFSDNWII